jgi:hypothetical protein
MSWFTKTPEAKAANPERNAAIMERIRILKESNARVLDISGKGYETQEVYDARKRRNAEGLVDANVGAHYIGKGIHIPGPTPKIVTKHGYLWDTKVSLERNLIDSDNEAIDKLLAKAETVELNPAEVDQVNTIKRIYTTLQIRAKDHTEYEAKLQDYSKLLQGYFKETGDKKGWFGTTKGRNTFKYLRNAQDNIKKTNVTKKNKNTTTLTQSIEVQQIHAYNEILGLILALTAKAHNKFQSKTSFEWLRQRSKERLTARAVTRKDLLKDEKAWYDLLNSYVTKYDSDAGIYSLSTISSDYVYDVVARGKVRKLLNLREELSRSLKNAKDKVPLLTKILWRGGGMTLGIVLTALMMSTKIMGCPVRGVPVQDLTTNTLQSCPVEWSKGIDGYCICPESQVPDLKAKPIELSATQAVISPEAIQQVKGQIKSAFSIDALSAVNQQLYDFALALQTHFLNLIPGVLPAVSEAIGIGLSYGIPTAAMLTYRTVKGALKTGTFKAEFIELHKLLFNSNNKIKFEDAIQKDFFVFNQLSQHEKTAILEFKKAFATGTPSDDSIKTYLGTMLKENKQRQLQELLTDVPPEQVQVLDKAAHQLYPNVSGWDLSYNPITSSFTYDCASDPDNKTAWPDNGPYGILNPEHCKKCGGAHCTGPSPVKVGGSRRNRIKGHKNRRKTHRK